MNFEVNSVTGQRLRISRSISMGKGMQPRDGTIYSRPADVDIALRVRNDRVHVKGSFSTSVLATCDRSLQRFFLPVSGTVELDYHKDDSDIDAPELELDSTDMNIDFHQGQIDLALMVNEQVALSLPMKLLKPGLPDTFTATFGEQEEEQIDERFEILRDLKNRMKDRQD